MLNININHFILPEILIASLACFILLWDAFVSSKYKITSYILTQAGLMYIIYIIYSNFKALNITEKFIYLVNDSVILNQQINFFKLIIVGFMMLIFVYIKDYLKSKTYYCGEYFVLNLLAALGMMIVISSSHFLSFYIGIEMISFPIYILIALGAKETNLEASIKYFVIGALFSSILLYGLSLIYGASGSLNFQEIKIFMQTQNVTMLFNIGLVLVFISLFFKLNLVPVHMWAPDIYHGAPIPVTILLATLPKITIVMIFSRIINEILPNLLNNYWQILLIIISLSSLILGNIGAMLQNNLKRLLAYSAIGHAGFILLGFIANTTAGRTAANFYVVLYAFITLGIFGTITIFSKSNIDFDEIKDFHGLAKQHAWLGGMLLILLLSIMGVPPTIGFYAKFLIIKALIDANFVWLAVFALMLSVVSMFYYLRIIKHMFFIGSDSDYTINNDDDVHFKPPFLATIALSFNSILALVLGVMPIFMESILKFF